jgi:tetratricopeptide (TPR) repeat protein
MLTWISTVVLLALAFLGLVFTNCVQAFIAPNNALIWKVYLLVALGGMFGGFVHALESDKTHLIPVKGTPTDTGAWGHVFIGFCGAFVALAVMLAIFGLDLDKALNSETKLSESTKYMFYLTAIGIVGGYSGLPIISLISNAALKKVQQEVDALKTAEKNTKEEVEQLKTSEKALQEQLSEMSKQLNDKDDTLNKVTLKSILLSAESYAKQEMYSEAIKIIKDEYLPKDESHSKAYFWLAWCEKRLMHFDKAIEYVRKSIALEPSRLGYYNLACYLNLNGNSQDEVMAALHEAWKHAVTPADKQRFKSCLQNDDDLATVRTLPEFQALQAQVDLHVS